MDPANWSGDSYAQVSTLQEWLARASLASLALEPAESVVDVGCGDGRITARIARSTTGPVLGYDPSPLMIEHARAHHGLPNLRFEMGDARSYRVESPVDRLVSFNALHWVPAAEQASTLQTLSDNLRAGGRAHLRLVCAGPIPSLEDAIEDVCREGGWRPHFPDFQTRFCHPASEQFQAWAKDAGLATERHQVRHESWDFGSPEGFAGWAEATFVPWTGGLTPELAADFRAQALARYGSPQVFRFYQLVLDLIKTEGS